MDKYFLHQIKVGTESATAKGIVICDTMDAALQGYHAYLGAYGYGHDPNITFVQAIITDKNGLTQYMETWNALAESDEEF